MLPGRKKVCDTFTDLHLLRPGQADGPQIRMKTEAKTERAVTSRTSGASNVPECELSEDQALAVVSASDVTREKLVSLSRLAIASKSRKVALALATHPRIPRHVSIPIVRRMFTFDLLQIALTPAVAPDVKRAAESEIMIRLKSLTVGERISLARRASTRVLAGLLQDRDARVVSAALDNSRLIERTVVASLAKAEAAQTLFKCVGRHPRWSQKRAVQLALLGSEKTPPEIARQLEKQVSRQ